MTPLASLGDALPQWVLVGGKGGVGKTTTSAALALLAAEGGSRTLLVSTDPAAALGDTLGTRLGPEPRELGGVPGLFASQLDAGAERAAFLERWRDALVEVVDRGTYLARDEVEGLVDAAFPGIDESMALLALAERAAAGWDRVIVDTAPTGHTLRLLELPDALDAMLRLLDAMQEKHRFMVRALTHRYRADRVDEFLRTMTTRIGGLRSLLADRSRSTFVIVTRPEPVVVAETGRYLRALAARELRVAALLVNVADEEEVASHVAALGDALPPGTEVWRVPRLDPPPVGLEALRRFASAATRQRRRSAGRAPAPARVRAGRPERRPRAVERAPSGAALDLPALTIVGGKGGVGKTTAACALAVAEADAGRRVLVVSTDPAPSVGDALDLEVGDAEVAVPGVRGLSARQMDASAAFAALRAEYSDHIDALFDAVLSRGVEVAHDRRIARELLALAPPGVDELYAVATLGELLDAGYERVIVDPAPTGHLLRLLEMPAIALDWSHRLLRLMLRYREVAGLGDTAASVLAFAKRTRALSALLADGGRSGVLLVALDEPLVRSETERLAGAIEALGLRLVGVLWNRANDRPDPLPLPRDVPQFVAPDVDPSPRGADGLRAIRRSLHFL